DPPALAVAEDHVRGARRLDHVAGDLAGERALDLVPGVLRPDRNPAPRDDLRDGGEEGERRAERDLDAGRRALELGPDRLRERAGAREVLVHLPVARDGRGAQTS